MKLHEYQSKQIFSRYGIPIPKGRVAATAQEVAQIVEELGSRVVIKAQVLVGGRGKAGGIRLAKSPREAAEMATQILAMDIKGLPVRKVLVDEAAQIDKEIYLGITNDRAARKPVIMASAAGGVDIEEVARETPEKIIKVHIDPLLGLRDYHAWDIAAGIDLPRQHWKAFGQISRSLWEAYVACDATLAEINPLVITADQHLLAVDGKMVIDDNALFRHPDIGEMRDLDVEAEFGDRSPQIRPLLYQTRRQHWMHGQWCRARNDHYGHHQAFWRGASELSGYRGWRRRGQSRCSLENHLIGSKCKSCAVECIWGNYSRR